jgi:basic amino acid/polyamine antiporter, APA family
MLTCQLGIRRSIALIVGFVIGGGIFRSPSRVALEAGSARMALLARAVGGAFALCGSLSLAELGAMFPRADGVYIFLYEAYGLPERMGLPDCWPVRVGRTRANFC